MKSRFFLRALPFLIIVGGILFASAGRLDLPMFWVYLGVVLSYVIIALAVLDPGLLQERIRPGPGGKDRYLRLLAFPFILCHWIVAGLDVGRFHWSDTMPFALQIVGTVGLASGMAISIWAMAVNPFFSPVVRIQSERGHRLITSGPYRFVRHPGYLGAVVSCLFGMCILGSLGAMLPIGVLLLLMLRRAKLEDRFLHEELEGYGEYAQRVRYRLIPGLW